jgi:putative salt-induced outer membrane protein YdiY
MNRKIAVKAVVACALALATVGAQAQENKAPGWYAKAIGSFASASGNTKTSTLGLSADVTRSWLRSDVNFVAGALRQSNTKYTFAAVNSTVTETETTEVSAETFFARLKGRYRFTERFAGYLSGDYERDVPAGIDSRTIGAAGIDYLFADREDLKFSAGFGVTGTSEDLAVPKGQPATTTVADSADGSLGVRFAWKLEYGFGGQDDGGKRNSRFLSDLIVDENLENTDGIRVNTVNAIEVGINRTFGLRLGLAVKYDNDPPVLLLKTTNAAGQATGGEQAFALKKTDMIVSAGLTVNVFAAR